MRLTIRNNEGKVLGVWVARTGRGFNQKQKKEIAAVRAQAEDDADYERLCADIEQGMQEDFHT